MRAFFTAILASRLLAGCASNCSILSSNASPACQAQLLALMVVAAPVALPYAMIKDAAEDHAAKVSARDLQRGVEAGDLAASEYCVFICMNAYSMPQDERWRLLRMAAERVVAADDEELRDVHRRQAVRLAAHKVLADMLWREAPARRVEHLHEVIRLGQSAELWAYVRLSTDQGNDLPVNDGHFRSAAVGAVVDLLTLQRELAWQAGERTPPDEEACDLQPFGRLPVLAGADERRLCSLAASAWKRRHPPAEG